METQSIRAGRCQCASEVMLNVSAQADDKFVARVCR